MLILSINFKLKLFDRYSFEGKKIFVNNRNCIWHILPFCLSRCFFLFLVQKICPRVKKQAGNIESGESLSKLKSNRIESWKEGNRNEHGVLLKGITYKIRLRYNYCDFPVIITKLRDGVGFIFIIYLILAIEISRYI